MKKKILFISDEIPISNANGYSTYNHAFLNAISEFEEYDLHLAITGTRFNSFYFNISKLLGLNVKSTYALNAYNFFGQSFIAKPLPMSKTIYRLFRKLISSYLHSKLHDGNRVQIGYWLSESVQKQLSKVISRVKPDVIFVDTIFRTPFLNKCSVPMILVGHDVFYQRCSSMLANHQTPVPNVTPDEELGILKKYYSIIAISEADETSYKALDSALKVSTLSSPVKISTTRLLRQPSNRLFYLGSQAHHNVDGILWFLDEIWPFILDKNSSLMLDVVGSVCERIPKHYKNVTLHGRLNDFSSVANLAIMAINPVRAGSGMKIKMLDYFSAGLGCLTTSIGASGFPKSKATPIVVANENSDWINTLVKLSSDLSECDRLSFNAFSYASLFSTDAFAKHLIEIVNICLGSSREDNE